MSNDTIRQRLQLSLGARALLGEELPSLGGRRVFAATCRELGVPLQVTLHPIPPEGPEPSAIRDRVARLQVLTHRGLKVPIAAGDLDGRAWVIEPMLTSPSALLRLSDGGALSVRQGIRALRDVTRAIATLHRAGLAHGGLDLATIHLDDHGAQLTGFGAVVAADARVDLDALGPIAWAFFTGDLPDGRAERLGARRRGIPEGLDAIVASLLAADVGQRPGRAEVVLNALDAFPTPEPSPIASFLEGAGRGTRSPRARETMILMLLFGLTVLISTLIFQR